MNCKNLWGNLNGCSFICSSGSGDEVWLAYGFVMVIMTQEDFIKFAFRGIAQVSFIVATLPVSDWNGHLLFYN